MGKYTLIDSNIKMLSKKVMDLEYKYNGMLSKTDIERRLRAYTKTKGEDVSLLSDKQYPNASGVYKGFRVGIKRRKERHIITKGKFIYSGA